MLTAASWRIFDKTKARHGARPMPGLGLSEGFFVVVEDFVDDALEEELRRHGKAVAQGGVEMIVGSVSLPGIQSYNGAAQAAALLPEKGHHLPGTAPARLTRGDAESVDDAHQVPLRRSGPGDVAVFQQMEAVKRHNAPEKPVLLPRA